MLHIRHGLEFSFSEDPLLHLVMRGILRLNPHVPIRARPITPDILVLFYKFMDGDNPLIPKREGDFDRLLDFALEKRPFVPWPIFDVMEEKRNHGLTNTIFKKWFLNIEGHLKRETMTQQPCQIKSGI